MSGNKSRIGSKILKIQKDVNKNLIKNLAKAMFDANDNSQFSISKQRSKSLNKFQPQLVLTVNNFSNVKVCEKKTEVKNHVYDPREDKYRASGLGKSFSFRKTLRGRSQLSMMKPTLGGSTTVPRLVLNTDALRVSQMSHELKNHKLEVQVDLKQPTNE